MRPYRGLRVDGKGWAKGWRVEDDDGGVYICLGFRYYGAGTMLNPHTAIRLDSFVPVHPRTVGQSTGMPDDKGVVIFGGDVLKHTRIVSRPRVVIFEDGCFWLKPLISGKGDSIRCFCCTKSENWKIIGTIHDEQETDK